ncbi:MAG: recombinase family protein [bacterium]|nr:recombinase family protein [bacterium]
MRQDHHQKVTAQHLTRGAYLYIRQSTLRQVVENTESTRRQYDLRERALSLGWAQDQIVVVDSDQGLSASTSDRIGFQNLVTDVSLGRAGLVMGLEVSRLARNSADWHRLLEICALSNTLILDEDGLYNPAHFNDRLLLGLKGTMSEAELYTLRTRLQGGLLNKARRGDLKVPLPVGFLYDEQSQVVLDPDTQVQEAIRLFFATFRRVGSALGTARTFHEQGLQFPRRPTRGPGSKSQRILWKDLDVGCALRVLQNPRYAGIFAYGRMQTQMTPKGPKRRQCRDPQDWVACVPDAHEGYITQQEYEENMRRLEENAQAVGADRRSPPREGRALLQGLVLCGKCGQRMTVHYHPRQGELIPSYCCKDKLGPSCQIIHGQGLDQAIAELMVELMAPMTLEVSISVQQELEQRFEETERLRQKRVTRKRYEADLSRQRFMQVDPNNRLVAATLEAEWNEKLRELAAAQEEFERRREQDRQTLSEEQKSRISALTTDFPKLWNDSRTPSRERKRMIRLLIEDVTLLREDGITAHIRFKGGATRTLNLPAPLSAWQQRKTSPQLVAEIDRLLDHHTESEIARSLAEEGRLSPTGLPFTPQIVCTIRKSYRLKRRYHRLRDAGYLTLAEWARMLHVGQERLARWRERGFFKAHHFNDRCCLYELNPDGLDDLPEPLKQAASRGRSPQTTNEV